MKLHLASDLTLPLDATTQAIGVVAKRRVGKSYTARRFAEQLFKAGQQIAIVDPKGDWWGIRSAADGKSPGLPVVILGGERGDVPLEVGGGEVVAKLVVEERVSVLLDLSLFRKREVARFMTDFLETLYRLKAKEAMRTPLMLIIDEADAIAPQKPQEGEERMLGAAEDIVRRGGQRGIGCMMITQRTAVLNKNVLTQCEMLVALRTIAPQDLKAMQAWIDVHGSIEERDTLMASLPSLPVGDAWFWSPGWPTSAGIFKHVHVLPIETFDSGATPKSGEKRVEPKNVADVDLAALTRQMSATIERAKADDPKELKREIAALKAQLNAGTQNSAKRGPVDQSAIDRAVAKAVAVQRKEFEKADVERRRLALSFAHRVVPIAKALSESAGDLVSAAQRYDFDIRSFEASVATARERASTNGNGHTSASDTKSHIPIGTQSPTPRAPSRSPRPVPAFTSTARSKNENQSDLTKGHRKILNAMAEMHALGISSPSRTQVGLFASYRLDGGTGGTNLGELVTQGLVSVPAAGQVKLTDAGHAAADPANAPSSLEELHSRIYAKLNSGQQRILEHLIAIYPESITRKDLGEAIGYRLDGGTGGTNLGHLVSLSIVSNAGVGKVAASELLFPESLS